MSAGLSTLTAVIAFGAGVISFLSPCVLPLVPGYISYVAGQSVEHGRANQLRPRLSALRLSAYFVLGFSTIFVTLGASATALGQLLLKYRYEANIVGGALVILFGLVLTGALRLHWLLRDLRFHSHLRGGRPTGAYVLGVAFAFGWTPCIGPVLGAILTAAAVSGTVASGTALLAVYSLGLGLPFLIVAYFTASLTARLKPLRRVGRWLQVGTGGALVAMGLAMITGQLTALSYWLLETFPVFATIG